MPKNLSPEAKARQEAAIKAWHAAHTTKICMRWRTEKAARYKALAQKRGASLSGLVQELLDRECAEEGIE